MAATRQIPDAAGIAACPHGSESPTRCHAALPGTDYALPARRTGRPGGRDRHLQARQACSTPLPRCAARGFRRFGDVGTGSARFREQNGTALLLSAVRSEFTAGFGEL